MYREIFVTFCAINYCLGQSFNSPPLDWVQTDENGAYRFGYATGDEGRHYHVSSATADNTVAGRFGYKDPVTGGDLQTTYTAGRRGFRARGPHIARRMDLSQDKPPFSRPNDDGQYHPELDNYFDPNEDRGYDFSYRTPNHIKEEHANRVGDVQGRYSYLDDIGFRHNVEYIAGSKTGFVVTNPVPDTFAQARGGPLYYVGKAGGSKVRGFSAVQKNVNGAYRFLASGPDHKRSEVSDASGNRRGVYTYLDDKGVQHTVEYIAGPRIGYKVINNKKGVNYNPVLPYFPDSPTIQPLFPSSADGSGGNKKPLASFPSGGSSSPQTSGDLFSPSSGSSPGAGGSKFPSFSGSGSGASGGDNAFPSFPGSGGSGGGGGGGSDGFPSFSETGSAGAGGDRFPSFPGSGQSSTLSPSSQSPSKPSGGKFPEDSSSSRPPLFKPSSVRPPLPNTPSVPPFSLKPEDFPSITPTFPPNSPFPIPPKQPGAPGFDDSDPKWNYDFDYFFNDPSNSNKDWSKPIKGPSSTKIPSTTKIPTFDPFPDFPSSSPFPDPSFLVPDPFREGLNTAESGNGLKPSFGGDHSKDNCTDNDHNKKGSEGGAKGGKDKNDQTGSDHYYGTSSSGGKNDGAKHYYKGTKALHYPSRGTVKFGGVKKNGWSGIEKEDGYFAIPPGVAVRAHVQSLDIVPYKRYVSPGEALEHHDDKKHEDK